MKRRLLGSSRCFPKSAKGAVLVALTLWLIFGHIPVVKADWESDANARIEQIRKRNAEILVVDLGGNPISNVSVDIEQVKHRFGFGTCLAYGLITNTNHQNFVIDHFEWAVCENEMKWSSNEETNNDWEFEGADYIANFCANNDIILRGHTLVWETGAQTPGWVSGLECQTYPTPCEMLEEVDDRINTTVGRYAGQIVSWDVDNEMLAQGGNFFDCLGEAGRAHFFQQGNSVDPNCGFYMNEYTGNSFGGYDGDQYASRALGLISLGAPVEGLGIQGHVKTPFNPELYYSNVLEELAVVGVPIIATEFDTNAIGTAAADDLENFYRICFSHASVEAIIMWGYHQNSWRWDGIVNTSTWTLNEAGVRYEALMDEWTTTDSNITNPSGIVNFRGFHGTYDITLTASGHPAELKTIELEPGSGTQQFILQMNIWIEEDITPPEPDPMTWASVPTATGESSIEMTATEANDISGVEYYFDCLTTGGHDSGWQDETYYEDTGLDPSTEYFYSVQARDKSPNQNETEWSSTPSATTWPPDITPPEPDPMTWASVPAASGAYSIEMTATTATDDNPYGVEYFFDCLTAGGHDSGWQDETYYEDTGLDPSTEYFYSVQARDKSTNQNETKWSSELSATTEPPPTDIEILGSWVAGDTHAKESGYNRALIFIAHGEHPDSDMNLISVTYGEQAMTKIIEINIGTGYRAYVAAYILKEAGIAAATSSDFTPTWNSDSGVYAYASVFLSNVNQTTSIGAKDSKSGTSDPISTDPLATDDGDMVVLGATCNNLGSYTLENGFTEGTDQQFGNETTGGTGVAGHKSATGAEETPRANYSASVDRQVIIGLVVQAAEPNEIRNCSDVQTGGYGLLSDLTGDCYVDYDDLDIVAYYWLYTDCGSYGNCENADFEPTDGTVDFYDLSDFALQWMQCNDPENLDCTPNW